MSQLTLEERYAIELLLRNKKSQKEISIILDRDKSVISREIKRNCDNGNYVGEVAHCNALAKRAKAKLPHKFTLEMRLLVENHLRDYLSPEQIVGKCKKDGVKCVSHEWIYQYIWHDKAENGDLHTYLRRAQKKKKKRYGSKDSRGLIKNRVSIENRPAEVDNYERIGDWEVDTIVGKGRDGYLVTAVERKTKYTVIGYTETKDAKTVEKELIKMLKPYKDKVLTITADNGKEFANHEIIAKKLNAKFYFAHPYASWERGLNENTNGLIRQFFPKKNKIREYGIVAKVKKVQSRLNSRPRKILDFNTPEVLLLE